MVSVLSVTGICATVIANGGRRGILVSCRPARRSRLRPSQRIRTNLDTSLRLAEKRLVHRTMRVKTRVIIGKWRSNLRRFFGSERFPPVGHQLFDSVCWVGLDPDQDTGQIRDWGYPVHFARRDECIKHSKVFARFAVDNEEKIDAPERDTTQSRLGFVVIGRNCRVAQNATEGAAIFEQISDGSRDSRFWFESVSMFSSPYKQPRKISFVARERCNPHGYARLAS